LADGIAKAIIDFVKRLEDFVAEALCTQFAPDLLHGVHLRGVGRDVDDPDVIWNDQSFRAMPACAVAQEDNKVVGEVFRQFAQEDIHHFGIASGHCEEKLFAVNGINRAVGIAVLPNVMAWDSGPDTLWTPTSFGFVDPSEACFVLGHQPNPSG
jgi:hypothetical protein